jgi:Nif-specific regulatory protein
VQGSEGPLGALHFYRYGQAFTERQVRFCEVLAGYLYRCLHGQRTRRALEAENSRLSVNTASGGQELIGTTAIMKQLRQQIGKLANGPRVVMVCGESGSGKELVALALHNESSRREGPLVAVNCAAIAASMPEAELFGHCRGSFTGADRDRPGYFQQADMGTLFLDEIGELSEEIQAKLLRVLEERKFRPVGAKAEVKADVRIVAATNRDLQRECAEGRFRQDLFYRLAVVELRVPPLREHREDIPALVQHFLGRLSVEYKRTVRLTDDAMRRLQAYHWPGNVRQLRSVLEHAVAMAEGPVVDADELHLVGDGPPAVPEGMSLNLRQLEAWAIRQALQQTGGVMVQAARLLGIHRDTLAEKMKQYGIDKHDRA